MENSRETAICCEEKTKNFWKCENIIQLVSTWITSTVKLELESENWQALLQIR